MSPIQKFLSSIGIGGNDVHIPREDPIGDMIRSGGHAPPSQIEEYRGKDTVKSYIIADAVFYLTKPRRTNDPELLHPANTQIRAYVWDLGYDNFVPEESPAFYGHDMPEKETLGANFAVVKALAHPQVFGPEYEWVFNYLANHRGTIHNLLDDRLATPEEIKKELKSIARMVGYRQHQLRAYEQLSASVNAYLTDLNQEDNPFGWLEADRKGANQILSDFLSVINSYGNESNLISPAGSREKSARYFEDFNLYLKDVVELHPNCFGNSRGLPLVKRGQSPLMHQLDHFQYSGSIDGIFNPDWTYKEGMIGRSYLEDLLIESIRMLRAGHPLAHVPIKIKVEENTDNLRKEAQKDPRRQHTTYTRGWSVGQVGGIFMAHLRDARHPHAERVAMSLNYHESELERRVIADYHQNLGESDTDVSRFRPWLVDQFNEVRHHVGKDTEEFLLTHLERESKTQDLLTAQTAKELLEVYHDLDSIGRRRKLFWIL